MSETYILSVYLESFLKGYRSDFIMLNKLYILVLIFLNVCCASILAQSQAGLYLTASDFSNKKLSHLSKRSCIKTHEVFKKDLIEIKCNDSIYTYKKDSVYGYRSKDGMDYRIVNGKFYTILNSGEAILIYKRQEGIFAKGQAPIFRYYFSKDYSTDLYALNLKNLETVFEDNKAYLKLLELRYGDNSNLLEYDNLHKMYKINRLLKLSEN